MVVLMELTERAFAEMIGVSPAYAHRIIKDPQIYDFSKQNGKQVSKQNGKQIKGVKSLSFIDLDDPQVSKLVSKLVSNLVSKKKENNKENISPITPIKEINKERELFSESDYSSNILLSNEIKSSHHNADSSSVLNQTDTSSASFECVDWGALVKAWNTQIAISHLKRIDSIRGQRKERIIARIKEYGKDKLWKAFLNAKDSQFLADHPSLCNIDWIIRPNNFQKVLDGNYN